MNDKGVMVTAVDIGDDKFSAMSAVTAEAKRLQAECLSLLSERDQLRAAVEALRRDAERNQVRLEVIRALFPGVPSDAELDMAIEAATSAKGGGVQ